MYPPQLYPGPTIQSRSAGGGKGPSLLKICDNVKESFHGSYFKKDLCWKYQLVLGDGAKKIRPSV